MKETTVALAPDYVNFWWLSIGLGFVLVAVVVVLLSMLLGLVNMIERYGAELGQVVDQVGANTANTNQLSDVLGAAEQLRITAES